MIKRIILMIPSILLLVASFSTTSSLTSNINKSSEKTDNLSDFQVKIRDWSYFGKTNEVFSVFGIFNTGDKYIEETLVVEVKISLDSHEKIVSIPYIG